MIGPFIQFMVKVPSPPWTRAFVKRLRESASCCLEACSSLDRVLGLSTLMVADEVLPSVIKLLTDARTVETLLEWTFPMSSPSTIPAGPKEHPSRARSSSTLLMSWPRRGWVMSMPRHQQSVLSLGRHARQNRRLSCYGCLNRSGSDGGSIP